MELDKTELTDRAFWSAYWKSKRGLIRPVPLKYPFSDLLAQLTSNYKIRTAIELGGFPGFYAVYLKKYLNIDSTLLDYFIDQDLTEELLEVNELESDAISVREDDLLSDRLIPEPTYDLVLSVGLIEHFVDTAQMVAIHKAFLTPGGWLMITLPNFRGLNGWVQKKFDPENLSKHNLTIMSPKYLASTAHAGGLTQVKSFYLGRFSVWLESVPPKNKLIRAFVSALWVAGKLLTKLIPFESRQLSPYIVLLARKPL